MFFISADFIIKRLDLILTLANELMNIDTHEDFQEYDNEIHFKLDWAVHCILKLISSYEFKEILDIGSGEGEHKRFFEFFGKKVISVDINKNADYIGDFLELDFHKKFDVIWCSHVLEHQRNTGLFLDKIYNTLSEEGVLAITVPNHSKERLIAGHLSSWSIPSLCYNLILSGFDCKDAQIISTYELSLIVKKKPALHAQLGKNSSIGVDVNDAFSNISQFFPFHAKQGIEINGPGQINWDNPMEYILPRLPAQKAIINITSKNFADYPQLVPKISFYP